MWLWCGACKALVWCGRIKTVVEVVVMGEAEIVFWWRQVVMQRYGEDGNDTLMQLDELINRQTDGQVNRQVDR